MAGAGLIDLKRRIKSVTNTRKITKAMGLVATSRLRKLRNALKYDEEYFDNIVSIKDTIVSKSNIKDNMYFKSNGCDKKLFIMLSSDAGLCGGYNSAIAAKMYEVYNKENSPFVMVIGQKGIGYLKKYGITPSSEYVQMADLPTSKEAKIIYNHALRLFREGSVSEVSVVYTDFISSMRQEVKVQRILPIQHNEDEEISDLDEEISYLDDEDNDSIKDDSDNYIIEFDEKESLISILNLYSIAYVHRMILKAKCSEYSSRMAAMDTASQNANDILDKLNTKYNRIRQSIITQEITEIVSGAEAQK